MAFYDNNLKQALLQLFPNIGLDESKFRLSAGGIYSIYGSPDINMFVY